MASYIQGYEEERFVTTVNRNFICLICLTVLKDPVLCPRNEHCFCRGCITKHLENSRQCPTCADELTVETLAEAPKMIKDILNELNIRCVYIDRGCQQILQLQHLDSHEATCGFTPANCTNQGCDATLNQRDLIHHESEVCEFRKLKCHSCGEMSKTLADIEKRMANMEENMVKIENMETRMKNMETNMVKIENMETRMKNMETNMATNAVKTEKQIANVGQNMATKMATVERNMVGMKTDMEGKFEKVNTEVGGMKSALIKSFNEMKDVLIEMKEENKRQIRNTPYGDNWPRWEKPSRFSR